MRGRKNYLKKPFGRKVTLFSFVSSFVCLESLGFNEAVYKQQQKNSPPCCPQEKIHRHLLAYVYTKMIGIASQSIEACFQFLDDEIQVQ